VHDVLGRLVRPIQQDADVEDDVDADVDEFKHKLVAKSLSSAVVRVARMDLEPKVEQAETCNVVFIFDSGRRKGYTHYLAKYP
jgi:hypothetical protein